MQTPARRRTLTLVVVVVVVAVVGLVALINVVGCSSRRSMGRTDEKEAAAQTSTNSALLDGDAAAGSSPPIDPGPVRVDNVAIANDLPAFVVRGAREHRKTMLFVGGMCVHPEGYAMAFAHAAAARGELLGIQGDVSCGGNGALRMWSSDLDAMNRRIDVAFAAAGLGEPRDVIVIGYSQGAERAEKLVAKWPTKYSRAILIASPITPSSSPQSIGRAKAVALMAGSFDGSRERMRSAASTLDRSGIPAAYFTIPNARHGQLGDTPDETMRLALDFVENASSRGSASDASIH